MIGRHKQDSDAARPGRPGPTDAAPHPAHPGGPDPDVPDTPTDAGGPVPDLSAGPREDDRAGTSAAPARAKIIACQVFVEELSSRLPPGVPVETLEMSLHERPRALRLMLQERIDASGGWDTIILGYGMCGQATVGLRATHSRLVLPRVDDCIAMFLGSRTAYRSQHTQEPGTYFLTKGWVGAGVTTPFSAYEAVRERWGRERAERMMGSMLRHYRRLAFVRTGDENAALADARARARATARRFGLSFDEIAGSRELVHRLLYGPWDERYIVVPRGGAVRVQDFLG